MEEVTIIGIDLHRNMLQLHGLKRTGRSLMTTGAMRITDTIKTMTYGREGLISDPSPPPTFRHNPFSSCSPRRNLSLFSRVVAEGLFTALLARRAKSVLSRPVFFEPVHFG